MFLGLPVKSQTAEELIKKMHNPLKILKSIRFEMNHSNYKFINLEIKSHIQADIQFDSISLKRPHIQKLNSKTIILYDNATKINRMLFTKKQFITIREYTREIFIEPINIENLNDKLLYFQMEIFPFFEATANAYLDSLINTEYESNDIDMKNITYEVLSDTACLSGDCYLVKISAPLIDFATEIANDTNDETTMVDYKNENHYFWINKKTYFPERYRKEWTLKNNEFGYYDDFRFTMIEKDIKMENAEFEFNKKDYKTYRIDEILPKGLTTIQEAFVKAPNIKGVSQNGDTINLYNNHSKMYLIDFWFSNCPPCIGAKRYIEMEIYAKYNPSDIMVLGINPIDKSFAAVEKAMKEDAPQYPYIIDKEAALQYRLSAYPGIYLLNSKFEVIRSFNTFNERIKNEIDEIIKNHLK